ncbi:26S proteasome regulatory subunit, putative, partial [Perkinsus marinus ATCC 50983]
VLLPLIYPELFQGLGVSPPRGLLLHGPPGTGKTLLARCLAGSCSRLGGGAKVSFFMRKGADVLSKWVGEGERLLRELFDQARKAQPSIIFFDEIDGLAPVRIASGGSSHSSSLVATLLALMDGLDGRGDRVVVLAATNRPDAVDPALRRPGRFDKELRFSPPRRAADRRAVLEVHTRRWRSDQMPPGTAAWICDPSRTAGFTGADLKALTEEAVMMAVRRTYPQIYEEAIKQTSGDLNGAKRSES